MPSFHGGRVHRIGGEPAGWPAGLLRSSGRQFGRQRMASFAARLRRMRGAATPPSRRPARNAAPAGRRRSAPAPAREPPRRRRAPGATTALPPPPAARRAVAGLLLAQPLRDRSRSVIRHPLLHFPAGARGGAAKLLAPGACAASLRRAQAPCAAAACATRDAAQLGEQRRDVGQAPRRVVRAHAVEARRRPAAGGRARRAGLRGQVEPARMCSAAASMFSTRARWSETLHALGGRCSTACRAPLQLLKVLEACSR